MLKPIFNELEMTKIVLTKFNESWLDKNPDPVVLYNIIQDQLSLNIFQRVVTQEVLSHVISNKKCQCLGRDKQLLFYIRRERGVGKRKIIEAIYLGFSLLKIRSELLIVAPTGVAAVKIRGATIYKALSIDRHEKNKK